jgi:hypothetical protein
MDGTEFARELINHFGPDRFYHCYRRMGGSLLGAVHIYAMLGPPELPPWKCVEFFKSIGIQIDDNLASSVVSRRRAAPGLIEWRAMCMVACGFCKSWKDFGLKTRTLPDHLHARMILGEKNEWIEEYAKLLEYFKEEMDEVRKLPDGRDGSPVEEKK